MSTEGSGETPSPVPNLPGAPEQTYLFPKVKGHSRSASHGGTPSPAGSATAPRPPLKSALRGHQRALSHGQIGEGPRPGSGHTRAASRTDFILPPGHRSPPRVPAPRTHQHHSRQGSRSDSIYTLRRMSVAGPWKRAWWCLTRRRNPDPDTRHISVVPNHLVPEKTPPKDHPNGQRHGNRIRTTKYTLFSFIPKNLFEQFHRIANVYFIFIVLLNWVPDIGAFGKEIAMLPVLFVLGVTAIKDLFEDRRRHNSDKRINNSFCRVYKKSVDMYVQTKWQDVRVGDLVHLSNNEAVPADMVLLHVASAHGICYLDTCNLDGETNLKQRAVAPGFREKHRSFAPSKFKSYVEVERPSTKIYRFNGSISHPNGTRVLLTSEHLLLRECYIKNTDYVEGIVVYAGHETKAMLNNGGPRYKCSKLERRMNTDVIYCVLVLLFLCCAGAVGCKLWLDQFVNLPVPPPFIVSSHAPAFEGLLIFWTYIIVLQVMIPISLYVSIEMTKLLQVYHIHNDVEMYDPQTNLRTECRALNITEELGQIHYLFSDKTGTLTENKMVFRRCTVNGVDYDHPPGPPAEYNEDLPPIVTPLIMVSPNRRLLQHITDTNDTQHTQKVREFILMLAVCNTVVVSQPHVDKTLLSGTSDKISATDKASDESVVLNGGPRNSDKYARLAESRSTTPSPPPPTASPHRLRLPKLFGSKEDATSTSSTESIPVTRFEAESPDELALAETALAYGYELRMRSPEILEVAIRGELVHMDVLRVQEFDANRKCMSIALKNNDEVILYVKGADSTIFNALEPMRSGSPEAAAYERTRSLISEYSRAGLRTLVMAKRVLTPADWDEWLRAHNATHEPSEGRDKRLRESLTRLESSLSLVGATGVEDRLQDGVPHTVRALLDAGIVVWVLTGDKPETAINIAYSAALFSQQDTLLYLMSRDKEHAEQTIKNYLERGPENNQGRALVVDGRTLTYILDRRSGLVAPFLSLARRCSSVLCCRATPLQKAYIVKAVKEELDVTTLAIGDGANDVSMIQTADVGIGLSGQEGRQAVMASDFALSRFKYIERLLLVHGHWCYDRLARMILYFFLKNATFVFLLFWYQLYNGFSSSVMIDQLHLMSYNLMFTAVPPMIMGAYDRVAPAALLMERPGLYSASRRGLRYQAHSYWAVLLESLYVSVVIYFPTMFVCWNTDIDIWTFGLYNMTSCLVIMLAYVAIETRSWTVIHVVALLASLTSFFILTLVYNTLCVSCFHLPSTYYVMHHAAASPAYWLLIALNTCLALAPRLWIQAVRNSMCPASLGRAVITRRRGPRMRLPYAAHYDTGTASAQVYRSTDEDGLHKSGAEVTAIT